MAESIIVNDLSAKQINSKYVKVNGENITVYLKNEIERLNLNPIFKNWLSTESQLSSIGKNEISNYATTDYVDDISGAIDDLKEYVDDKKYTSVSLKNDKFDGNIEALSVRKLTQNEYFDIIQSGGEISNCIYIVSSGYHECYGQVLSNAIMTDDRTESEVATKHYVDSNFLTEHQSLSDYSTTNEITSLANSISVDLNDNLSTIIIEMSKIISKFGGTVIPLSS